MKNICGILVVFLCTSYFVHAQNECVPGKVYDFQNQIDGFKSIVKLENGEYITGGSTWIPTAPGNYNMCFARVDACGDSIWTNLIGQNYESFVDADICYSYGDDFVVSTSTYFNHITQMYGYAMVKLDLNGDTIWLRTYLNSLKTTAPKDVIQTLDGGFALVGFSQNFPNDYARIWFIKTDADGNIEWDRYYGTANYSEAGEHLMQLPDGGYLILGSRIYPGTETVKIWLIRTDPQGDVLWERFYGNNFATYGSHIIQVSDGYVITGNQYAAPTWQIAGDAYIQKIDTFGITQWVRTYGGEYSENITKIMPLEDGNFMCVANNASFGTGGGSADGWLFKISAEGDSLWSRTYRYETAAERSEYLWDFQPAPDDGFMLAGFCGRVFPNNQDAWVIRTDSLGNPCMPLPGCEWAVGIDPNSPPDPLKGEKTIHIYPNPAQNTLTFERVSKSPLGDLGVTVDLGVSFYNLTGQTVLQTTLAAGETNKTISVAHLPEGVYVYTVAQSGAVLARGKVAVVR